MYPFLERLLTESNCSVCPVFIGGTGDLDTSGNEPDEQFDTALRILEVSRHSYFL